MGSDFLQINGNEDVAIPSEWEFFQWTYVYLFSDAALGKRGFGAYVPGVGTEKYERTLTPTLDLTSYEGSYGMRIGTKVDGAENIHLIAKMNHFKGTAIHKNSVDTL